MEIKTIFRFIRDCVDTAIHGGRAYHIWMAVLTFFVLAGMYAFSVQLDEGLQVTGMNDRISWGLYISNFTFFVGVAAAAVMLVMPAYVLHDLNFKQAVLIGEGLAVAALSVCLVFVVVDMGGPARAWHLLPVIGYFNWPNSMLAWDVLVLNGYLLLNFSIPAYILYCHYKGIEPNKKIYLPGVLISIGWAVSLHLVTAFLYAGLPARPFWNNSLLGPRFLASAFAAGPALIVLILEFIRNYSNFKIGDTTIKRISMIVTVAAQINLVMLLSELFKEFYAPTHHSLSAQYVFFGLEGSDSLVPWVWTGIALNLVATGMLTLPRFRNNFFTLKLACAMLFVGIWIEKGLGLIIPGFIPGPWGKIVEYTPTWVELVVCLGVLAMGAFIFSVLAKIAIRIETGDMRYKN